MTGTRRHHTRRGIGIVAAVVLILSAYPAAAEPDDNLDQTIDPNQAQGTGRVVIERGHIDVGPTLNTGEWKIQIHDDTGVPSYWRNLEDVALHVKDSAILEVPDNDSYTFLGQEPGTKVWVVPQTQKSDVVWAGWNTQEPNVLSALSRGASLTILNVHGPGDVTVYLQSGNFGEPQPVWTTLKDLPQESWIEINTHTHANWVFSKPGIYLIEIQFSGELNSGETVSAKGVLRYAVGNETNPLEAFAAEIATQVEPSPAEPTPAEQGAGEAGLDAAEPPASSSALATTLLIVGAAVTVAIFMAAVLVARASRRAKARANAAIERGKE